MNKIFENITVLTTNRTESIKQHLEDYNVKARYFHSIYNEDSKVSYNMSITQIMKTFDEENILIIEDDCGLRNMDQSNLILKEIKDWDILYLGYNIEFEGCEKPLKHSEHWVRLTNAWGTHCIAFKKETAKDIIERYDYSEMFDNWLGKNLYRYKAYGCVPMLAWQLPSYSDLWKQDVNYTNIYIHSEQIARNA